MIAKAIGTGFGVRGLLDDWMPDGVGINCPARPNVRWKYSYGNRRGYYAFVKFEREPQDDEESFLLLEESGGLGTRASCHKLFFENAASTSM